jgi:hypothetical protein
MPKDFEKLKMLVPHLPKDSGQLPPLGRRLVFQVLHQGRIRVRVYDEQKLPEVVREVIGILDLKIFGLDNKVLPIPDER